MAFSLSAYRDQWLPRGGSLSRDVLAGIVVALALIPEAIGFSVIAGGDPRIGLCASVAIAMTIALIGHSGSALVCKHRLYHGLAKPWRRALCGPAE